MGNANAARLAAYEARSATPMLFLAMAFLAIYSVQVLAVSLPTGVFRVLLIVNLAIWASFLADLVIRLALTDRRGRYVLRHPIDVLSVALPALRPLRAFKAFTAGQQLLGTRTGLVQTGQAIIFGAALLVYIGAIAMLDVERGVAGSFINDIGDALWWALVTVTTVGYGDVVPVTPQGRAIAASLMVLGVAVLGAVTATAASWLLHPSRDPIDSPPGDVEALTVRLEAIEAKLDALIAQIPPVPEEQP